MARIVSLETAFDPALECLKAGQPVAIPTETVYGLAADATNAQAVACIFEAKGRPRFNPLIVHVADFTMAQSIASFDERSLALAQAFWPGPLTLVLPLRAGHGIAPLVTAGLDTVALRMPKGFARQLIRNFARPLAAPSANSSGRISPTSAAAVDADLGSKISLIVDGGPADVGLESTIVKVIPDMVRLLRPGAITADDIGGLLGMDVVRGAKGIEAPGMMTSHYVPNATMRLDVSGVGEKEALLAFGPHRVPGASAAVAFANLSPSGNLCEAAASLYAHLKMLDAMGVGVIAVEPVPDEGVGEAINDRLRRAAAPRKSSV